MLEHPAEWKEIVVGDEHRLAGKETLLKAGADDECSENRQQKKQCMQPVGPTGRMNDLNLRDVGGRFGIGKRAAGVSHRRKVLRKQTDGLIDGLKFLARLEAHRFAGRNIYFGAGARVASDAGLARPNVEDAETAQFNAVTLGQSFLHTLEDSFHRHFGFGLGDAGLVHNFVDDIELDHKSAPQAVSDAGN